MSGPGGAAKGNPFYEVMGVSRHWRFTQEKMDQLIAEGRVIQTSPGAVPHTSATSTRCQASRRRTSGPT
jgi:hypothetical protein